MHLLFAILFISNKVAKRYENIQNYLYLPTYKSSYASKNKVTYSDAKRCQSLAFRIASSCSHRP